MESQPAKLVIRNIGMILSGKMEEPILDGDCLIAIDGKITEWGTEKDMDCEGATTVVDAKGVTLAPGLIDSHVHPVVGDYTPRQQQLSWIDSTLHGGVTTLISAGEVHMPGRPKDVVGLKAMAIASANGKNRSEVNIAPRPKICSTVRRTTRRNSRPE